jgi:23S rRNA pseudouridine1911/1915/1917 synthase
VLLAKNAYMHTLLQQTDIKKTYHALVLGGPVEDAGTICAPIARRPLPSLLREVREDGKQAITEFAVLERMGKLCKLSLRPITGRTHQLRVHCAYMGYPILGDPQYGAPECMNFGWEHQALCAKRLEFVHPITEKMMILESRLDAGLNMNGR